MNRTLTLVLNCEMFSDYTLLELYKHAIAFEEWDVAHQLQEEIFYRMGGRGA
jgi:hypothetical protein